MFSSTEVGITTGPPGMIGGSYLLESQLVYLFWLVGPGLLLAWFVLYHIQIAILCSQIQDQAYYTGPVAKAVTGGCELGIWLGAGFTILAYPPLRVLELRFIGR